MTLIKREGTIRGSFGRVANHWMQYWLVSDDHRRIVELEPAAWGGWRFVRVEDQGHEAWLGWSEASILAFCAANDDPCRVPCEQDPELIKRLMSLTQAELDTRAA
jgi:hypothetical protein